MPRLPIGDCELNVEVAGSGPPVLLIHGFPLDRRMWREQVSSLADVAQLIVPDLRGFGHSTLGDRAMSMELLADDLAEMLAALEIGEPVVVCGLSMGGYVAWQFWRRHAERMRGLVLCDTKATADSAEAAANRRQMAEQVMERGTSFVAEAMLPKMFSSVALAPPSPAAQLVKEEILQTRPETIAAAQHAMAARPDVTAWLPEIDLPALVVVGAEDAISPPKEMRTIADALPQGEFVEIADAGHMAPLERPAPVNAAFRAFLQNLTKP